jgi:hypothetical protein
MTERNKGTDDELDAMVQVIGALEPLDELARSRVLDYVFRRLGLRLPSATAGAATPLVAVPGTATPLPSGSIGQIDIRTLKDTKKPKSAQEMAAIVAYYLSELAPAADRKDYIDAGDVKKYFKQADFPLPGAPSMTLIHARNAGYLDTAGDRGRYKVNPVGYNLVVHNLPARADATRPKPKNSKTKKKQPRRR